jgi:hypothetical protein
MGKSHSAAGVAVGVGAAVGVAVAVAVGLTVGEPRGVGVTLAVDVAVAVATGVGACVVDAPDGIGAVGVPPLPEHAVSIAAQYTARNIR